MYVSYIKKYIGSQRDKQIKIGYEYRHSVPEFIASSRVRFRPMLMVRFFFLREIWSLAEMRKLFSMLVNETPFHLSYYYGANDSVKSKIEGKETKKRGLTTSTEQNSFILFIFEKKKRKKKTLNIDPACVLFNKHLL